MVLRSSGRIRDIMEDRQGRIWVGTFGGGVSRLNDDGGTFTVGSQFYTVRFHRGRGTFLSTEA